MYSKAPIKRTGHSGVGAVNISTAKLAYVPISGLMHLSFPQTDDSNYFPGTKF